MTRAFSISGFGRRIEIVVGRAIGVLPAADRQLRLDGGLT
jgi:hypothetical protein